jgi:hypothetical protein
MTSIADLVPRNNNFMSTGERVRFDASTWRAVCLASDEAKAWDGAPAEVTHSLYSERHGVWCYCEISVQDRTKVEWKHGAGWGRAARVRFWNEEFGEWHSVTLFEAS